jgi:hypothetical protein
MDLTEKTITALRNRFDVTRGFGFVAQGFAQALHRIVDTLIEFDKGIGRPKALLKFLSGDELAGFFQKNQQHRKRLILKLNADAMLAQLPRAGVELEDPEPHRVVRCWEMVGHEIRRMAVPDSLSPPLRQDYNTGEVQWG